MKRWSALALLVASLAACRVQPEPDNVRTPERDVPAATCAPTIANGAVPPGERPAAGYHGNGQLWTALWPDGTIQIRRKDIRPDGALPMKFPWWRGTTGPLQIEGRRLDGPAPPLRSDIPLGYGETGFQASAILFPTAGCWEVTGRAGSAAITFVTLVQVAD
jgi:hypothetical protein